MTADSDLTPLGAYLEAARVGLGLSKRAAAKRAEMSEGRWRQVVTGRQSAGGVAIPVNPRPETVTSMARAVGLDPNVALELAGLEAAEGGATEADSGAPHASVVDAIASDPDLLPEAKEHLTRQYGLLLRVRGDEVSARRSRKTATPQPEARRVATKRGREPGEHEES